MSTNSVASPTVHDAFTRDDAPVLCLICTGTSTGSRLVATLTVRPEFTLAEVRHLLEKLARTGDGGDLTVREAPQNVTQAQATEILEAPLHPFDLTAPFSFVRCGGCRSVTKKQEQALTCSSMFPRFPRLGLPQGEAARVWSMSPAAPLVVVPYFPPVPRVDGASPTSKVAPLAMSPLSSSSPAGAAQQAQGLGQHSEAHLAHAQKRLAAAVLFVAQGDPSHPQVERALTERLLLSQQLGASSSTAVSTTTAPSSSAARRLGGGPSSFGQRFSLSSWSSAVTRWNANLTDYTGRTTLQEAAAAGNEVAVKFLLSQSYVAVNTQTAVAGNTALHMAVHGNHAGVVKLLVEEGNAEVLLANAQGNTALHVALLEKRAAIVALLCQRLRARGQTTLTDLAACKNRDGYSPIALFEMYSPSVLELAHDGRVVPVKALVSHFLFVPSRLRQRDVLLHGTIFHAAASSGNDELVRFLCEEVTIFPEGCRDAETSPVNLAAMASSASPSPSTPTASSSGLCRWMLDGRFQTPLHVATMRGHLDCAHYLATRFPYWLSVPDVNGDTPLLLAIKYRQFHVAEFFLVQCPPGTIAPNVCDHRGLTALHYICGLGMAPAAEALLEQHGAKANANTDRLAMGSVCRPLNNNGRIWGPHQRNRLLVKAGVTIELSSAKRADALRAARRSTAVAKSSGQPPSQSSTSGNAAAMAAAFASASGFHHDGRLCAPHIEPSYTCGGGLRGSTPLQCALVAGRVMNVRDVLRVLCRHGGIDSREDACDLFFYLLTHNDERLANEVIKESQEDGLARAVRADNVLLLRFCEARCERGIRWCIETRCGGCDRPAVTGLCGGITHPLVMSAAAGDVGAVQYLLSRGADVNVFTTTSAAATAGAASPSSSSPGAGLSHPLLTAIVYQQEAVAQVLVQSGSRLSSGDGSWCALQAAALIGLESVVQGLLGNPALSGYDVAQSLVAVLQKTWATSTSASFTSRTAAAATVDRWESRTTAPREARDQRIALALAQHYDPTTSEVHPTELLHLSAARGFFAVTRALLRRFALLPSTLRAELVQTMPAAPARVCKLVEPTMEPPTGGVSRLKRLLPNTASGKGGLYRPPKPFERLVVPNWSRPHYRHHGKIDLDNLLGGAQRDGRLLHRVHLRDVFSYAAGTNDAALFQQLRDVLPELLPWTGPDARGWTAMDYALHVPGGGPAADLVCLLLLTGVTPRSRHDRRLLPTRGSLLIRAVQSLVPAMYLQASAAAAAAASARAPISARHTSAAGKSAQASREGERQLGRVLCALLQRGPCDVRLSTTKTHSAERATSSNAKGGFASHGDLWTLETIRALLERYSEAQAEVAAATAEAGRDAQDAETASTSSSVPASPPSSSSSSLLLWLRPVVHTAVQYRHLDALELMQTVLACPFSSLSGVVSPAPPSAVPAAAATSPAVIPSPLLAAVASGDEELVAFFLRAGCSAYETSPMTLDMARLIPLKHADSCVVTPLCYAAWAGRVDLLLQLVGGSHMAAPAATTTASSSAPTAAVRRLKPEQCADEGAQLGDALKALFHPASLARCRSHQPGPLTDSLVARAVHALAAVGHPYLSPLVLRMALASGLDSSARALVQCYGAETVRVDLIPEELNSLHYLAACPAQVPLLRSLLVATQGSDQRVGLEVVSWSPLALAIQAMDCHRGPIDPVDYALAHGCVEGALLLIAAGWTGGSGRVASVHARLVASVKGSRTHAMGDSGACASRVASVLRHFQSQRRLYVSADEERGRGCGGYTILHSAVALGHDEVVRALVAEMCRLPRNAYVQGSTKPDARSAMEVMGDARQREHPRWRRRGRPESSDVDGENEDEANDGGDGQTSTSTTTTRPTRTVAPSVYALAALHESGAHYLTLLEEVARREQWLRPRDLVCFFFNPAFRVTRVVDALCRQTINAAVYGQVFSLLPELLHDTTLSKSAPQDTPYAVFFAKLWQAHPAALLVHGASNRAGGGVSATGDATPSESQASASHPSGGSGSGGGGVWALTACTALTAAIASARLEWVQYMAFCDPSMRQHRATLTYCDTASRRGCGNEAPLPSAPMRRARHGGKTKAASQSRSHRRQRSRSRRRVPRPHRCGAYTHWSHTLKLTATTVGVDALVLSVLYMANAFHSRDAHRRQQHVDIFSFLLSLPGALTRGNVNLVAMALAAMQEWELLDLLLTRADQFRRLLTTRVPIPNGDKTENGGSGTGDKKDDADDDRADGGSRSSTRYFTALLDEEIPAVLRGLLGSARHIMHLVARWAPKETIIEVARRSQRGDVEACVDSSGRTALFYALHHYNPTECGLACFAALRVPLHTVCCQRTGRTPVMVASSEGRLSLVTTLLESSKVRGLIDQTDRRGETALMLAAAHGHAAVVELLVASDAKTSVQSLRGRTAVMLAAEGGHDEVASALAQNFSQTRGFVSAQSTVLHGAALGGAMRTIAVVLKQLADPVAAVLQPDSDGHTALYVAHAFGCGAAVRAFLSVLFQPGADRHALVQSWAAQSLPAIHEDEDVRDRARIDELNSSDPWFAHVLALHAIDDDDEQARHHPAPCWQRLGSGAVLSPEECDARLYLCDPRLTTYGWWRGVLAVNTVLTQEAAAATASWSLVAPAGMGMPSSSSASSAPLRLRPGERVIAPVVAPLRGHVRGPRGQSLTCLLWCAQTNNAVGVRVLADYNVADVDGLALRWASKYGHLDCIKLLVELQMSDPAQRGDDDGLYAFEVAARHQHTQCALYLLAHTRLAWLSEWMPPLPPTKSVDDDDQDEASNAATAARKEASGLYVHTAFHRLAPVCEGEVLVAFVDQLLAQSVPQEGSTASARGTATALTCARLWAELQRPDEAGLTPFEYTVARGNAASVLRTAQLMQRLSDGAQGIASDGTSARSSVDAVSISSALLRYLPTLSPSVRTLLFDFFALQDVCHTVGFRDPASETPDAVAKANGTTTAVTTSGAKNKKKAADTPLVPLERLRFGDVRLLGIATLRQQELFRPVLSSVYTVDHERQVLRGQLYDFPFRIRFEPESFRACTLAEQIALLQWLSSSLLLDAYAGISADEVETIEISVVKHRSQEFLEGIGTVNLAHSLYISSSQYVSLPEVRDVVWSAVQQTRAQFCRRVRAASRRATKTLQSLPHPALRRGVVSVEWPLQTHEQDTMPWTNPSTNTTTTSSSSFTSAADDARLWTATVQRLCEAMSDIEVYLRGAISTALSVVRQEGDIAAVVRRGSGGNSAGSRRASTSAAPDESGVATVEDAITPYHIVFRYVAGADVTSVASLKAQRADGTSGTCVIYFNETGISPLYEALDATLLHAVQADVTLVGIHYARSRFVKSLKSVLQAAMEEDARDATAVATRSLAITSTSTTAPPPPPGGAAENVVAPPVQLKLELENSSVGCIPLVSLEAMLDAAVEAATLLLVTEARDCVSREVRAGSPLFHYRSTRLVRDGVLRRLRHVLVLFTTRRDALVRFTGEKLMLCFTPNTFPNTSEILDELKRAVLEDEVMVCQRALPDVLSAMQEKLQALLPSARLTFDETSLTRAVCTSEEDNPSDVRVTNVELQASAYRLLVAQHSRLVLQPLIEGLTMGWNTAIGAIARQELREVHVRMETAADGSCYLTSDGSRLVYYCPLDCVQYGRIAQSFGGWQLLTATQVASLYVMQLLVRHRSLAKSIDRNKAVACWTGVSPLCVARMVAGTTHTLWLHGRNLLNQPVHRGGDKFTFVGRGVSETSVRVLQNKIKPIANGAGGSGGGETRTSARRAKKSAEAAGRYAVRFTAPDRAGDERLHILLHGQPIAASPLRLRIESGPIDLAQTRLVVPFNTVLVKKPFEVRLELHDALGNRLTRAPEGLQVAIPIDMAHHGAGGDVEVLRCRQEGPWRVAVQLVVRADQPALTLALALSVPEPLSKAAAAEAAAADGVYFSPTGAPPPAPKILTHTCMSTPHTVAVVTRYHLDEIFALLAGQTLDSVPERQRRRRYHQRERQKRQRQRLLQQQQQQQRQTATDKQQAGPTPSSTGGASEAASSVAARRPQPASPAHGPGSPRLFGSPTGQRTMTMSDREKLFFRKTIRLSERRRLKREAASVEGGIAGRVFAPELLHEFQT